MKRLKLFLTATVLTLAFAIPAFAGDIETTVTSQLQTPPAGMVGDIQTTVTATNSESNETATIHPVTDIALSLMRSMFSLF